MIKNFLAVAVRSFLRQRFYSAINILGLATGLASALFIFLWVRDEVLIDKFHRDVTHIYRVVSNLGIGDGEILTWTITPGPLGEDIQENIPGVELAIRTMSNGAHLFQYQEKNFLERGLYADSGFFRLFSFPIVSGTIDPIGRDKKSVAISEKLAKNLFGDEDPIGKVVRVARSYDVEVKSVFADIGPQSSLKFDFILPLEIYKDERGDGFNWGNYDHPLYLRLTDPSQASDITAKINARSENFHREGEKDEISFYLQPFSEQYLHSQFENGVPVGGRITYVQIFSIVAAFIVIIACINFMNMATARAASRAKEVGVRKVVGAQRVSLISQFIAESVIISCVAMIAALFIVFLLLPMFNTLVAKEIHFRLFEPGLFLPVLVITLITGFLAGSYPAFFLSSYRPASVLKGRVASSFSGASLRRGLVVFQFALTVILTASALVIYEQVEFIRGKNVGYNRNAVINFSSRGDLAKSFDAFRNDALQVPGIQSVSRSNQSLVQVNNQNSSISWPGKPADSKLFFRTVATDFDFLQTMGLTLEDGRMFSRTFGDSNNFVLTRNAVETMGLDNALGTPLSQWGASGKVVGVVKDFHSRSMHETIDPIVFICKPQWTYQIYVRYDPVKLSSIVESLGALHKKYSPEFPFEYSFLDDDFEKLYNNEKVTGSLAFGFTLMAIIISALGLLGLAAYTAERRKKEISIRKTLGASVSGIISMISGDFVRLNLMAIALGCPTAYWLMSKFLDRYAYHTSLDWKLFLFTAAFVVTMSLSTVIFQVARAARVNPVDALRNE